MDCCWRVNRGLPACVGDDDMPVLDTPEIVRPDGFSCGAVSLEVVYGYYGLTLPRAYRTLSNPARGMAPETAEAAMRSAFGGVCWGQGWDFSDIRHHLKQLRPVMCLVSGDAAADHWLIVRGYEARRGGRVLIHDPANGRETMTADQFHQYWTGPAGNAYARFGLVGWPV